MDRYIGNYWERKKADSCFFWVLRKFREIGFSECSMKLRRNIKDDQRKNKQKIF